MNLSRNLLIGATLASHEVISIAAVVEGAQDATVHRDQDTNLFIEVDLIRS